MVYIPLSCYLNVNTQGGATATRGAPKNNSSTWVRTTDLMVNSHTLYQLSHRGNTPVKFGMRTLLLSFPRASHLAAHGNHVSRGSGTRAIKKIHRRVWFLALAGFDPATYGLWAHHASAAPKCCVGVCSFKPPGFNINHLYAAALRDKGVR